MQIAKYIDPLRQWINTVLIEKPAATTTHRCCVAITPRELLLIHINKIQNGSELELLQAETLAYDDIDNLPLVISSMVDKNELQFVPTYWLLPPQDYQLFLIESLPVPENEFRDALSWRIRGLLTYPVEDAVLDYFSLPAKKSSPTNNMIGAVTAKTSQLNSIINLYKKSSLTLSAIDIPEFALRNLTALYEDDEKSTAMIYFYDKIAILNITRNKTLYFTRRLDLSFIKDSQEKDYEHISLEILRYFDYFQSQWGFPSPGRVFVAAEDGHTDEIVKALSTYLLLSVEAYKLKSVIASKEALALLEKKYLLITGCAFRKEASHATPGH